MDGSKSLKSGLVYAVEPVVGVEREGAGGRAPAWRGRVSDLSEGALKCFWVEALEYAQCEIGRYRIWRGEDEPVLPSGYDAEGVVQAAFERLLTQEAGSVPIYYSGEEIRRQLRRLIKHRVRWLHERKETGQVVSEWAVMPPRPDGELVSVFDYLPGGFGSPDEELMRKEKEQWLGEFKAGFEVKLGARRELLEVFRRIWEGQTGREMARELGAGIERVRALQVQVRRRLAESAGVRIREL